MLQALSGSDHYNEPVTLALIDSAWGTHAFSGTLDVQGRRQLPPTLNVALNLNLQLPPNLDAATLPAELQQLLANVQQALLQQAQQAVQQALRQQAPLLGAEARVMGGQWSVDA